MNSFLFVPGRRSLHRALLEGPVETRLSDLVPALQSPLICGFAFFLLLALVAIAGYDAGYDRGRYASEVQLCGGM
jgi:hypothetical protein